VTKIEILAEKGGAGGGDAIRPRLSIYICFTLLEWRRVRRGGGTCFHAVWRVLRLVSWDSWRFAVDCGRKSSGGSHCITGGEPDYGRFPTEKTI